MTDDTQMNGSLHLPEFEDRLWEELAAAHAAHAAHGAQSDSRIPLSGRSAPGGRSRLLVAASVLAVGGLVAAGLVVATRGDRGSPDVEADGDADGEGSMDGWLSPTDEGEGADGEAAGEEAAAEGIDEDWEPMIVHVTQENSSGGTEERWEDEVSARNRSLQLEEAGTPVRESAWLDLSQNDQGIWSVHERTVDHEAQTWTERRWSGPQPQDGEMADPVGPRQQHEDAVASGNAVEDGLEEVDGRELLRVVDALPGEYCATNSVGNEVCDPTRGRGEVQEEVCPTEAYASREMTDEEAAAMVPDGDPEALGPPPSIPDLDDLERPELCVSGDDLEMTEPEADPSLGVTWLDPETYRPVRRQGSPGSDSEYTTTYEYLERTEENQALLVPEIPEGYTEVESEDAVGDPSAPGGLGPAGGGG